MAWRGWDGRVVTLEQFKAHIETLAPPVWAKQVTLHNTDKPDIAQGMGTPPATRMVNLQHNYKVLLGWSGAPNLFVFPQGVIGLGTPLTQKATHSAGFNGHSLAIEMVADFALGQDDDDAGLGLKVKDLSCKALAVILDWLGKEPVYKSTWYRHKDDPRTSHDCPGNDIEAADIQARVLSYWRDLNEAGDHGDAVAIINAGGYAAWTGVVNVLADDWLNFRAGSGTAARVTGKLPRGTKLTIIGEAKNGETLWLRARTPMGYEGWVSAKYVLKPVTVVKEPEPVAPVTPVPDPVTVTPPVTPDTPPPQPKPELEVVLVPVIKDHNDTAMALLTGLPVDGKYWLKEITRYGFPEYRPFTTIQAAGGTGNSMRESYPRMVTTALGDKINGVFTAYGINQWRNERQTALFAFCKKIELQADSIVAQLLYMVHELHTSERQSGDLLRKAETLVEAVAAGVSYERPKGWRWPLDRKNLADVVTAARKGDGWDQRLAFAQQMLREYDVIDPR
jgi:hypothetical protein